MAEEHELDKLKGDLDWARGELGKVTGDRNAWRKKSEAFEAEATALKAKYEALHLDHNQMIAALPPAVRKNLVKKPAYVYGDDECAPVARGQTCSKCGWSADKSNPKHADPHPIQ